MSAFVCAAINYSSVEFSPSYYVMPSLHSVHDLATIAKMVKMREEKDL